MLYSKQIVPISYLKANASEIVKTIAEERNPLIITHNGEAKLVILDIKSYEETQETLALLKLLAISEEACRNGKYMPLDEAFEKIVK